MLITFVLTDFGQIAFDFDLFFTSPAPMINWLAEKKQQVIIDQNNKRQLIVYALDRIFRVLVVSANY
jgi:hypothetical protein